MRLLPGWLAAQEGRSFTLDGDASIRRRPVDRIAVPLRQMGAELEASNGRFPPLTVRGAHLRAISYELPISSAQVKSCVLLAALAADGATTVGEPERSRDHTERMLLRAGVDIHRNGRRVTVVNADELILDRIRVPGDPSSAAFLIAAGVLVPGSRLLLRDVGVNWTRTGFLRIVRRMRGIVLGDLEDEAGELSALEPVSDLDVAHGALEAAVVEPEEVPLAIDELPLVALLGCFAEGKTVVHGAGELRLKESDRIAGVVEGLRGLGADIEATADGFAVQGSGELRGGSIDARGDHRMAMMGAVAGLASREGVEVARGRGRGGVLPGVRRGPHEAVLVAIDGPAGAGKSTVARALADRLGYTYLDSGAMYRCVALLALGQPHDEPASLARRATIELGTASPGAAGRVLLDGRDVTDAIRAPEASEAASRVAGDPGVREALVAAQRELIARGDLGRRGARHRHRGRARRRAEGLPDRRCPRARAQTSGRAGRGPGHGARRADPARRARRDARAQPAASRTRSREAGHDRSDGRRGRGADRSALFALRPPRTQGGAARLLILGACAWPVILAQC